MHIISPDKLTHLTMQAQLPQACVIMPHDDRIKAALQTILTLPPAEFDFFVQNALQCPEQDLECFYASDPNKIRQPQVHIGIEEFIPAAARCGKFNGDKIALLDFLPQLKTAAKTQGAKSQLQQLESTLNWWDLFVAYYSRTAKIKPEDATRLLVLLEQPQLLSNMLKKGDNAALKTHIGYICDRRLPDSRAFAQIFGAARMADIRENYESLKQQGINFDRYINPFYTFEKVQYAPGKNSILARAYRDKTDFTINPQLLAQLDLASCHETTPEAKAIWLYTKLCATMQYDEGYFYRERRVDPNDDPLASLQVAAKVTADTPVTCFNFARLAVKLLNQIKGVEATLIALGSNLGHFRFGFYTDKISVDAEPINPVNGYNDLARAKLGIPPLGLTAIYGAELLEKLVAQTATPLLTAHKQDLQTYLQVLQTLPSDEPEPQIDLKELLAALKANGVDGASVIQVLINLNRHFAQPPYELARAGAREAQGITPKLLVRNRNLISQIDLKDLSMTPVPNAMVAWNLAHDKLFYADEQHTLGGLEK